MFAAAVEEALLVLIVIGVVLYALVRWYKWLRDNPFDDDEPHGGFHGY